MLPLSITYLFSFESGLIRFVTLCMGKHSILGHTFQTLLLLACLRLSGIDAPHTYEGSLNGDTFRDYVAKILVPTLQPGEVLILDNSSAHTVAGILDLIYAKGVYVVFLVQ